MGNATASTRIPAVSDVDKFADQAFIVILGTFFVVFWCVLLAYTVVSSTLSEVADWARRTSLAEMQLAEAGGSFRADGMLEDEDEDELTDPPLLGCVIHTSPLTHTYTPAIDHQDTSCNKSLSGGGGGGAGGAGGGPRPTFSPMCARHTTHAMPATTVNSTESTKSALPRSSSPATASSAPPSPMRVLRACRR